MTLLRHPVVFSLQSFVGCFFVFHRPRQSSAIIKVRSVSLSHLNSNSQKSSLHQIILEANRVPCRGLLVATVKPIGGFCPSMGPGGMATRTLPRRRWTERTSLSRDVLSCLRRSSRSLHVLLHNRPPGADKNPDHAPCVVYLVPENFNHF